MATPTEFESVQLANLKNEYDGIIAEIKSRTPLDDTYTSTQVTEILELLSGALERFKAYDLAARYLHSAGLLTLGNWLSQFRSDTSQAREIFRQKLEAHVAANRQEILNAQRKAAEDCDRIFVETTARNKAIRDASFEAWHAAQFPTPVALPVCPHCRQPFGINHSRAICPVTGNLIFTQVWS
jgi:hypothetical protein